VEGQWHSRTPPSLVDAPFYSLSICIHTDIGYHQFHPEKNYEERDPPKKNVSNLKIISLKKPHANN
jgi:hypothetical protein